ncbi:MAG TPA: hypothetical protein PKV73_07075 [Agriterribacter sp.]|nr:hypothetical protein [Chitinophagaceae bacterium]HRP31635.1 hypothetical protein [Agriterribacter sp.]
MKKSILVFLLAGFLWACNSGNPANNAETTVPAETHAHDATLSLNNGQKWKADAATNDNVVDLRTIAQNFSAMPHTELSDYQILNNDLQKGLDTMIKECKMQGPDHDALHVWLEPLIKDVGDLKKAGDITSAGKTFQSITERLEVYNQYFE